MANDPLQTRIDTVADGNIGVFSALLATRQSIGDKLLTSFLDKVPEKGEQLWVRFRDFQKDSKDRGAQMDMTFGHFVASVLMPNGLSQLRN